MGKTILICDDDATVRSALRLVLARAGYAVSEAGNQTQALTAVRNEPLSLILMDMNYSRTTTGEEGLELLAKVKVLHPEIPVILITAWGSIGLAVQGIRGGAFDFVTKPWNNLALLETVQTAIQLSGQSGEETVSGDGTTESENLFDRGGIIGQSPLLRQVLDTVSRVSATSAPVLITGESGTGKELIAETIHRNSLRKDGPFVKVNLGGISQSLFESEMFGHRKGAFTDAYIDRKGRFETADRGTIFLDEIGELDSVSQVKLLRVLQDQTFEVLGDSRPRQVNTRVISATNRHIPEMIREGTFREDLFYRINLITIRLPALRERREDIPLLVRHFVRQQQAKNSTDHSVEISAEAMDFLRNLPYPGNIRELKNLVDRTMLISRKPLLTERDFQSQYVEPPMQSRLGDLSVHPLEEIEKEMILKTRQLYGGNLSKMAVALGLTRQALYRRMEKYGIKLTE